MGRDFQTQGETLVAVKGSQQSLLFELSELGLASEGITVTPNFKHKGIKIDDFGPDIPAEMMVLMASVNIRMPLIHYDRDILEACMSESLGGYQIDTGDLGNILFPGPGTMMPAGSLLGNGLVMFSSGNHLMSLNLFSEQLSGNVWHFPSAYLAEQPVTFNLGTKATIAVCNWTAFPYAPLPSIGDLTKGISSSGRVLWDRIADISG